jgi:hypothetical protein
MPYEYMSDREKGPKPRLIEEISLDVWRGLVSVVTRLIRNKSFGESFPLICNQNLIFDYDDKLFISALKAEIMNINWPLNSEIVPSLYDVLDFIEFCHRYVSYPEIRDYHSFADRNRYLIEIMAIDDDEELNPGHYHIYFKKWEGQKEFRDAINLIFSRNGIIYELNEQGKIIRQAPEGLRELFQQTNFQTGDTELNNFLNTARIKFLSAHPNDRKESLEKLWDAWERLKTIEPGYKAGKKDVFIISLLQKASSEPKFCEKLTDEARALTKIGNEFMIRHTETDKTPITSSDQIDYLFHRMFSLIYLILKSTNRLQRIE